MGSSYVGSISFPLIGLFRGPLRYYLLGSIHSTNLFLLNIDILIENHKRFTVHPFIIFELNSKSPVFGILEIEGIFKLVSPSIFQDTVRKPGSYTVSVATQIYCQYATHRSKG